MSIDVKLIRKQFPSLKRKAIFVDNPAGTQVPKQVMDKVQQYFMEANANSGGFFVTSRTSDEWVEQAHAFMADFLNAEKTEEIVIGANMTTLTFAFSRAIGKTFLKSGDRIVLTHVDHEGNVTPWTLLAEDLNLKVDWIDFHHEDCTLDLDTLKAALKKKPKLVCFNLASNLSGTINPTKEMVALAHAAGAMVYLDAVQYAPHHPIDVRDLDADFLVCSSYKFFGPHLGILYGKLDLLNQLKAYKVRTASATPPGKFETGTGPFELMAGLLGLQEYFDWLTENFGSEVQSRFSKKYRGRKLAMKKAMGVIEASEYELNRTMMESFQDVPGLQLFGIDNVERLSERVPTYSFIHPKMSPANIAKKLAERDIFVWAGNFYAYEISKNLGREDGKGGVLRIGGAHYNTKEEIAQVTKALKEILG